MSSNGFLRLLACSLGLAACSSGSDSYNQVRLPPGSPGSRAHGTRVALRERPGAARPSCPLAPGAGQPIIELSNAAGVELQFIALASDDAAAPGAPPANVR
jgi:hypothetical protein